MKEEIFQILEAESSLHITQFGKLLEQLDREGLDILHDVLTEITNSYKERLENQDALLGSEIDALEDELSLHRLEVEKAYQEGYYDGVDYVKSRGYEV